MKRGKGGGDRWYVFVDKYVTKIGFLMYKVILTIFLELDHIFLSRSYFAKQANLIQIVSQTTK